MSVNADDRREVAMAFMKRTSRDTFNVCATSAEEMAVQAESGALPMDAPTALRFLATMFRASAERPRVMIKCWLAQSSMPAPLRSAQ